MHIQKDTAVGGHEKSARGRCPGTWVWTEGGTQPVEYTEQGIVVSGHAQAFPVN